MHILITGAAGMIGRKLTERLIIDRALGDHAIEKLTLIDIVAPARPAGFSDHVKTRAADLAAPGVAEKAVAERPDAIFHLAGVVSGKTLGAHRPWIIVGIFVFAAVATPSTDPFTMTFMAIPMVLLYFVSEVIARVHDRRKAERRPYADLDPDQPSPL